MAKLSEHKWPVTAFVVIFGALFLTRGGLAALVPLLRIILPVFGIVLVFRVLKGRLRAVLDDAMHRGQGPVAGRGGARGAGARESGAVIDLCPKCGSYLRPGHRCASSSGNQGR